MARRPSLATQADIARLIMGAVAAGVELDKIAGVKLTKDGVTVLFGDRLTVERSTVNEWDEVL